MVCDERAFTMIQEQRSEIRDQGTEIREQRSGTGLRTGLGQQGLRGSGLRDSGRGSSVAVESSVGPAHGGVGLCRCFLARNLLIAKGLVAAMCATFCGALRIAIFSISLHGFLHLNRLLLIWRKLSANGSRWERASCEQRDLTMRGCGEAAVSQRVRLEKCPLRDFSRRGQAS